MGKMLAVISEPRPELKSHVPRITTVQIPVDKIGAVIGPGGKVIRSIQEETGATIDIGEEAANDGKTSARKQRCGTFERAIQLVLLAKLPPRTNTEVTEDAQARQCASP